jgi:hypothetical protein
MIPPPQIAHAPPQSYADFNQVHAWNSLYDTDYNPMFNKRGAKFAPMMSKLAFNPGAAYGINQGVKRGQSSRSWHTNCFSNKQMIRDTLTRPQFPRLQTGAVGLTIRQQSKYEDTLAVGMPTFSSEVVI